MSEYIVSARKYRPISFDEVIGQDAIITTLINSIKSNQLGQSFLFCGPRGIGKTTCARIFAKEINRIDRNDELNDYSFNIFELDGASNNSVDDIRSLTEQVRIPPQIGKYKVYIIDEVHMLSQSAFNAFLKTLEEPPKHAKFILATTEKHKILPTILSRCQIFDFKRVSVGEIADHLASVAEKESVKYEKEALYLIANKSDGAVRDSLSLFDRLVSSSSNITYKGVITDLNILDYEYYFKIVDLFLNNDIHNLLIVFNEISENGYDGHYFLIGLAQHLRDLLVSKDEVSINLLEKSPEIRELYLTQSKSCDLDFLISALDICNECDKQYKTTLNQRLLIEFSLMQIASLGLIEKKKDKIFLVSSLNKDNHNEQLVESKKLKDNSEETIQTDISLSKENYLQNKQKVKPLVSGKSNLISISDSVNKINAKDKITESTKINKNFFTLSELSTTWSNLVKHVKLENKYNLSIILISNLPQNLKENKFELHLNNSTQMEIVSEEMNFILKFLRKALVNDFIEIKTKLVKSEKKSTLYTNKEKFDDLLNNNKSLVKLSHKLGLDPEY